METEEWERIATPTIITAKQMILICLILEVIVSVMFIFIARNFDIATGEFLWWVLQFFGLVVATNLGAVILAVIAQKTANDLGAMYRKVFTPDFYMTLDSMTRFRTFLIAEAEAEGKTLDDELEDVAVKMYRLGRAHLDVRVAEIEPIEPMNESATDEELFGKN